MYIKKISLTPPDFSPDFPAFMPTTSSYTGFLGNLLYTDQSPGLLNFSKCILSNHIPGGSAHLFQGCAHLFHLHQKDGCYIKLFAMILWKPQGLYLLSLSE